jgi:hypothetical protein
MSEIENTHSILDLIKSIASNRESGRLEIGASGTRGALLFTDGKLVDAKLGSLEGFQAVNAAVALRDVEFSFVHATYPPHSGTIGPNERVVLSRFFGIEAAEIDEAHANPDAEVDWNLMPEQVVPLAEVEDMPQDDFQDTPTIEAQAIPAPVLEEAPVAAAVTPEATVVSPRVNNVHAFTFQRARVALYLALILAVTAAVAIALRSRLNARRQVASVATSVESKPQPVPEPSIAEVKQETVAPSKNQVKQVTSKSPSPVASAERRDEPKQRIVNAHDLAGEWRVINTVENTAYKSYNHMQVGFRLNIKQSGKDFTATGEKFSENGRNLPQNSRTPIQVTGSIDGDKIVATFVEDGLMRRTNGRFVWKLQSDGTGLTGTFVSTAANSRGKSAAIKQP